MLESSDHQQTDRRLDRPVFNDIYIRGTTYYNQQEVARHTLPIYIAELGNLLSKIFYQEELMVQKYGGGKRDAMSIGAAEISVVEVPDKGWCICDIKEDPRFVEISQKFMHSAIDYDSLTAKVFPERDDKGELLLPVMELIRYASEVNLAFRRYQLDHWKKSLGQSEWIFQGEPCISKDIDFRGWVSNFIDERKPQLEEGYGIDSLGENVFEISGIPAILTIDFQNADWNPTYSPYKGLLLHWLGNQWEPRVRSIVRMILLSETTKK